MLPQRSPDDGAPTIDNDTSDGSDQPPPDHSLLTNSPYTPAPLDGWAAVILAAGRGTRMESTLPKAVHPVAGRPMLQLIYETVSAAGFENVVVVTPDSDGVVAETARHCAGNAAVTIAVQEQPSGTADAALVARKAIDGATNLLFLNCDQPLFTPRTLREIAERHANHHEPLTFLTAHLSEPAGFGRVRRLNGRIQEVVEDVEGEFAPRGAPEVNAGAYAVDAAWLWPALTGLAPGDVSGERYLTSMIAVAVADGGVQTHQVQDSGEIQHVSTQQDLAEAERVMRERTRRHLMDQGVTLLDPATTYIDVGVSVGAESVIEPGVHLRGSTSIGSRCQIGPNSVLRDMRVGDDCTIGGSTLEGSTLADGVTIGPYCHIRSGASVESDVHLGNYVELKASRIGAGTKIGHFSYIGDTDVGSGANIGAGTVTVNYDGELKHRTRIGDGAFIGSDSMLIAPVEIGDRARTGAGSVVTRDVLDGATVFGVPAQDAEERAAQEHAANDPDSADAEQGD